MQDNVPIHDVADPDDPGSKKGRGRHEDTDAALSTSSLQTEQERDESIPEPPSAAD